MSDWGRGALCVDLGLGGPVALCVDSDGNDNDDDDDEQLPLIDFEHSVVAPEPRLIELQQTPLLLSPASVQLQTPPSLLSAGYRQVNNVLMP